MSQSYPVVFGGTHKLGLSAHVLRLGFAASCADWGGSPSSRFRLQPCRRARSRITRVFLRGGRRMEIKRLALVLVDISGYTRFMRLHTMSLLHAEAIITELLEAVIDQAHHPLTLSKLEGDAAFLYAVLEDDTQAHAVAQDVLQQVMLFFDVFNTTERALIACDACRCEACNQISRLKLKAFLHVGEAVIKKVRQFEELAGEDVILIHRLLKNSVAAKEYVLMTQAFHELSGGLAEHMPETRIEECEGLGEVCVTLYCPPGEEPALPPRPAPAAPLPGTPFGAMLSRWNRYAARRMLGRTPRREFSHLPDTKLTPVSLWDYFVVGIGSNAANTFRHWIGKE
ncbi:MAG: DUF2652 domain-containing protein [Chloroflexota bacterium]|nr:DUF2652 domain-containing protein [Chloroflexota bacterium]